MEGEKGGRRKGGTKKIGRREDRGIGDLEGVKQRDKKKGMGERQMREKGGIVQGRWK